MAQQTNGALAKAAKIRAAYIANPRLCAFCQAPILPKPGGLMRAIHGKKYCSRSCSTKAMHAEGRARAREPTSGLYTRIRICGGCGEDYQTSGSARKYCTPCWEVRKTIRDGRRKGDVLRREIAAHASHRARKFIRKCSECGYDPHVEVCHVRAVTDFPPEATLDEINATSNLVMLCPNHHWEFDRGRLPFNVRWLEGR